MGQLTHIYDKGQRGLTLVELLITIAVAAVLLGLAVPSFIQSIDKTRLVGATENLATNLRYAQSESIKRHRTIFVAFSGIGTTNWCYGLSEGEKCDCTDPTKDDASYNPCTVSGMQKVVSSVDYKDISLGVTTNYNPSFSFNPIRNTVEDKNGNNTTGGSITLTSTFAKQTRAVISGSVGRINLCSPSSAQIPGYPPC